MGSLLELCTCFRFRQVLGKAISCLILTALAGMIAAVPAWGEDPLPDFPASESIGNPPGFGDLEDDDDSTGSPIGNTLANGGYGLAALLTYLAIKRLPSAVIGSWFAGGDFFYRGQSLSEEASRLIEWGRAMEVSYPVLMARLEAAVERYNRLAESSKANVERKAAAQFVRAVNGIVRPLFDDGVRPLLSLGPDTVREPGKFFFHQSAGTEKLSSGGVLRAIEQTCESRLALISARVSTAVRAASPVRLIGTMLWPFVPALGSGVGGYYAFEGLRHLVDFRQGLKASSPESKLKSERDR